MTTSSSARAFGAASGLLTVVLGLGTARAQDTKETTPAKLEPTAPWSVWCVAPACQSSAQTPARAGLLHLPEALDAVDRGGALESQVKAKAVAELQGLTGPGLGAWDTAPMRDLVRAVLASVTHDEASLRQSQGMAAALVRAALTLAAERMLPATPSCDNAMRVNAVYEGLAMSRGLGPLTFTERKGDIVAACVPLAQAAERWVDGQMAGALVSKELRLALKRASAATESAAAACASPPNAGALSPEVMDAVRVASDAQARASIRDLGRVAAKLRAAKEELGKHEAELGPACAAPLREVAEIDAGAFTALDADGFSGASPAGLVDGIEAAETSKCETPDACAARDFLTMMLGKLREGLTREALIAAVHFVAKSLGVAVEQGGLQAAIVKSLEDAVVIGPGGAATIDQGEVVHQISERYTPGVGLLIPSSWVVDVSAGVPSLTTRDFRVVGDATLGYRTSRFGIVGSGGVKYFDITDNNVSTDNLHAYGALDAWLMSGDDHSPLRWQGRISGGVDYYDATTIDAPTVPNTALKFGDYNSLLIRGLLEAGVQWQPSDRTWIEGRVGGGLQYETYDTTSLDANGVSFTSPTSIAPRAAVTATVRWRFAPRYLAARLRVGGNMLALTRETIDFQSGNGGTTYTVKSTSETQLEAEGRGFLDLDVVGFAGFVPALWGGFDYVSVASSSTFVPAGGIGIVRPGR